MATLDDTTRAQIETLTSKAQALLDRNRFDTLDALAEQRHALLARHLGFTPIRPVPVVTVVGDSHALFFAGTEGLYKVRYRHVGLFRPEYATRGVELLPCFRVFSVGPSTAWQAFEYGSGNRGREKLELLLRKGDLDRRVPLLLSYGEIDCRCHIPRVVQAGTPMAKAVENTIHRFLRLPQYLRAQGFNVAIWGPACVTSRQTEAGHPLPVVGPYNLRRDIMRTYVQTLEKLAADESFPCACLAGAHHAWEEEAPAAHLLNDGFHLSQAVMPMTLARLQQNGVMTFGR